MSYSIPPDRVAPVQRVLRTLEDARSVILTTHINADGDGTGCQAALLAYLESQGVDAWIVNPTPFPDLFRFLIPDQSRILDPGAEETLRVCQAADLCVVVDTAEIPRIGRVNPLVDGVRKVVIDHHPPGDRAIVGLYLQDEGAAAAGELVFDLLVEAGGRGPRRWWTASIRPSSPIPGRSASPMRRHRPTGWPLS
jgi:bifunctional oligoribonuclease and PAP phosphatase NrnA